MDNSDFYVTKISEILKITKEETIKLLKQAFIQEDPFQFLSDLLGFSNVDLIFEIYKFKDKFLEKDYKNEQAMFIEHIIPEIPVGNKGNIKIIDTSELKSDSKYFSYKKLNPVQSAVFNSVYKSDDNTLVAAPTGAGKTDIALMALLRALRHPNSQVIYIVPMKALASEIYSKYSKLFNNKYFIIEYTGDTEIDSRTAAMARIIVCTPEKFDVATRKLCCIFQNIRLVVIDEIHLLEDDRGPVLESIVARISKISEDKQIFIRILGLSATLPNFKDVAEFIKAKNIHFFDQSYRPVPLKMTITGFTKASSYKDELEYLFNKTSNFIENNKQILIFVHSRAKTYKIANFLIQKLANIKSNISTKGLSPDLHRMVSNCIGVHHAGLSRSDRSQMENLFTNKNIKILITTSTLAWGVNLPAYAVIIHGFSFYNPHLGKFSDISILDILQIFGRAGRPQFDTSSEAILMVTANKIEKYVGLLKRNNDIESKMLFHVPENLNAEIYLNHIYSISSALKWIKNTFLYIRMLKNPALYGISPKEIGFEEQALSEYIYLTIKRLEDCKLINITRKDVNYNTWTFESTFYGQIASIYYLNHFTMYTWLKEIDNINNELSLIDLLLKSVEFKAITVRNDEITYLNTLYEDLLLNMIISFDFDETVESKLMILFIAFLNFKKIQNFSLSCDTDFIVDNMKRLISAIIEILLYLKRFDILHIAFLLEKRVFRFKKEIKNDISAKITRINDNFVNMSISNLNKPSTVFVFDKNKIIYAFKMNHSSNHIFRCNINKMNIEIHSNDDWIVSILKQNVEYDYSLNHLYNFGIHCCDTEFRLCGIRNDCAHFHCNNSLTDMMKDKLSITPKYNKMKEETFNNLFNETFRININYIEIDSNNRKEFLKMVSYKINKVDLESILIVCPNIADVEDTQLFLNTQAMLENHSVVFKYEKELDLIKNCMFGICTFEEASKITGFKNVIFKGVKTGRGVYPLYEILKICNNRKAIIYENFDMIFYFKSIIKF